MGQKIGRVNYFAILSLVLFSLMLAQLPVVSQTRRGGQTRQPRSGTPRSQQPQDSATTILTSSGGAMGKAFKAGTLPDALPKPAGSDDEVAATLAKLVSARDEQSVAALLTAITTAGFVVRGENGTVKQTIQPGQGLSFEAWEVAAMAKMYGEGRSVELTSFADALRSIPELKQAPLEKILLDGIRKHAQGERPELRFWARFIVELGRHADEPYDLLDGAKAESVRLDTIQAALLLRRLVGDFYASGQRSQQGIKTLGDTSELRSARLSQRATSEVRLAHAEAAQTQPCRLSDVESTVADGRATILTTAFSELMSIAEKKVGGSAGELFGNYGKFVNIANILLAYAKFIATYAALETEISVENPPLVRNTDVKAGQRRQLIAKVSMNIGKWQQVNCIRWLLNAGTGMDFNLLNDGPLEGVEVNWHLTEGGGADFYSSGDRSRQIVWFVGTGPRIQDAGTYAGAAGRPGTQVGILTRTKTDAQGKARVLLEGASRRNYIPAPHIPVMKQAVVMTTVKLKGGDIKGDAVDIAGHVFGGMISLGKKEGFSGSAGGMFTLPLELLYRTDWASTARVEVPVKDWESCDGGWYGTVTYAENWQGKPHGLQKVQSKSHHEVIDVKGNTSLAQGDVTTTDIYEGRANVANSCLMFRRHFGKGTGRREAQVRVLLDGSGGYKLFVNAPAMEVITKYELSACGHGGRQDQYGSETGNDFGVAVNGVEGSIDPAKPDEISGSAEISDSIKLTWNLRRCK